MFVLDNSYHESNTVISWLKNVQASRTSPTRDDSIEKYENTMLLASLTGKGTPQPFVPQEVVDLSDKLQVIPVS
ncbi:hypothetical protein Plhal304r1_c031g0101591 [Plasmopara halstedii]